MQNNDLARKVKLIIDGIERTGLVSFGEINREKTTKEVPSFSKLRSIQTGVDKIPAVEAGFKVTRNSDTKFFLKSWYENGEVKDVTVIETDGAGVEIDRLILSQCELSKFQLEEVDSADPPYFRINVTFLPYDIEEII